jgi:hypothetical protein
VDCHSAVGHFVCADDGTIECETWNRLTTIASSEPGDYVLISYRRFTGAGSLMLAVGITAMITPLSNTALKAS